MTAQNGLREKIRLKIAPLLEMALSLTVILNPERFTPTPAWVERLSKRVQAELLEELRLAANTTDFLALACDLDANQLPVADGLQRLGEQDPKLGASLQAYWEAFAPEAAASSGVLGESLQQKHSRLNKMEPVAFLRQFSDRINVSEDGQTLVLDWGRGLPVPLKELDRIVLVPSTFCPRRLMFYRHGPVQYLFYNPLHREDRELPEAPESLVLGFSALSDPTRLRLLKLVAREKLPAQDMARRLEVHESTVSRHLKFLTEAGLVAREGQEGKFVFYTLNLDRLDALVALLRRYITQ